MGANEGLTRNYYYGRALLAHAMSAASYGGHHLQLSTRVFVATDASWLARRSFPSLAIAITHDSPPSFGTNMFH